MALRASFMNDAALLQRLEELALEAGAEILHVLHSGMKVDTKADQSPVTEADQRAEAVILAGLRHSFPDIPCVAEEEAAVGTLPRSLPRRFFLVDPLDGTREFINGRPDFTVNIALISEGAPIIGVVYAPAQNTIYSGFPGHALRTSVLPNGTPYARTSIGVRYSGPQPTIVASRSHRTVETDTFIDLYPRSETTSVGSSLKFCLVASGRADLYPRFGRTMEWDTAAGDAVLRAAGGCTFSFDGKPLAYGKRDQADDVDFANPWFLACGGDEYLAADAAAQCLSIKSRQPLVAPAGANQELLAI
jgi:3'(2'), 5'-bisphosphate nucleotidase